MTTSTTPQFVTEKYALDLGAEISGEAMKMAEILDQQLKNDYDAVTERIDRLVEINSLIENKAS